MGVYSTVEAELECQRCEKRYRTDVQFYTDDDRDLPRHRAGESVPALKPDSNYEGIADAFCADCMNQWVADEKRAAFEALAQAIGASEVIARYATYQADPRSLDPRRELRIQREAPLTSDEARRLGNRPERIGWPSFSARLAEASVVLFRGESPLADEPGTWWLVHQERVRERLSKQGWRAPADEPFRDVTVRVAADGTIEATVGGADGA